MWTRRRSSVAVTLGLVGVVAVMALFGCAVGPGSAQRMQAVAGPWHGGVPSIEVLPDDAGAVLYTQGPDARVYVIDSGLSVVNSVPRDYTCVAVDKAGKHLLGSRIASGGVDVRTFPDMSLIGQAEGKTGGIAGAKSVIAWGDRVEGIVLWKWLDFSRFGFDAGGQFVMEDALGIRGPYVLASAVDWDSRRLVVVCEPSELRVYDLDTLDLLSAFELPCESLNFSVATNGGTAWVGTREGCALVCDLSGENVVKREVFRRDGDVFLALSNSGSLLVAVACEKLDRREYEYDLVVYRIDGRQMVRVFSDTLTGKRAVQCVAFLESHCIVLLGMVHGLSAVHVDLPE